MQMGIQRMSVWDRLWEKSLLRPGVVLLRILVTLMAFGGVIAVFPATNGIGDDIRMLAVIAGIVAVVLLYFIAMVIPDFLWYVLEMDRVTVDISIKPAPRSRYPFFLFISDLARFGAVATIGAALVAVIETLEPSMFGVVSRSPAQWWTRVATVGLLLLLALVVFGFVRRVRGGDIRASRNLVGAFGLLIVLDAVLISPSSVAGLVAVLFLGVAITAARRAYVAYRSENTSATVAAGVLVAFCSVLGMGAWRTIPGFLPGVKHILGPWLGANQSLLSLIGAALRGRNSAAVGLALIFIFGFGVLIAVLSWVRGDFYRSLLSIFCSLGGDGGPRSRKPHLVVVRWMGTVGILVLIIGSLGFSGSTLLLIRSLGLPGQLQGMGPGWFLVITLGLAASVLAILDLFQGVADARARFGGRRGSRVLDFRWLKIFTYTLYLFVFVLAVGFVGAFLEAEEKFRQHQMIPLAILVAGVVIVAVSALLPEFFRDLMRLESATRPAEGSRVRAAVGYPGFSFLIGFGRFLTGVALVAGLLGTAAAVMAFGQRDAAQGLAILIVGILGTVVLAIQFGAGPDLLSLLLSLKRNFQEMEDGGPEMADVGGTADLLTLLPEALKEIGEAPLGQPFIPPSGEGLARIRGSKGMYEIRMEEQETVLFGPDGRTCGRCTGGVFVPEQGGDVFRDFDDQVTRRINKAREGEDVENWPKSEIEELERDVVGDDRGLGRVLQTARDSLEEDRDEKTPAGPWAPVNEPVMAGSAGAVPPPYSESDDDLDEKTPEAGSSRRPLTSDPVAQRESTLATGWTELLRLPLGAGDRTQSLVVVALAELLIVRDLVNQQGARLTSELRGDEVVLLAARSSQPASVQRTALHLRDHRMQLAGGLVAVNLRQKRFSTLEVEVVRDPRGKVLAPGWVAGEMPPLRVRLVNRRSGSEVSPGMKVTRRRVAFVTRIEDVLSVWEVKV